jgi:hypothetical protein
VTTQIIDRAVRLATRRLPRWEQNRIRELCLEATRDSNPGEASRIATEIAGRESEAWLEHNRQREAERAKQVTAGAAAFARQMEALVGEGGPSEPTEADEPSQPECAPQTLEDLAFEREIHQAIRRVLDKHKNQGGHFLEHDYEDLEQVGRLAVLDATRRCERDGKEMTGALAYTAAKNAAVKFVLECSKHTNPALYERSGKLVKKENGKPRRGTAISMTPVTDKDGNLIKPRLQDINAAFFDNDLSPERYAANEEVRTLILNVVEGLHGLQRKIAEAVIDADFEFNVGEYSRAHNVPERTAYRAYAAVKEAFRAVLKKDDRVNAKKVEKNWQ